MSASKLNPNTYNGEERNGGYIARNEKPISARSPHWRGKVYLIGIGWYWVSGWDKKNGSLITLLPEEMTDEQAMRYYIAKNSKVMRPAPRQERNGHGGDAPEPEIPF